MALVVANDTVEKFEAVTGYRLSPFLNSWVDFIDSHYQYFIDYFKGVTNKLPQEATDAFTVLFRRKLKLEDSMANTSDNLDRMDFWNLLDYLDEINGKISYIASLSKFLRTAKYEGFNEDSLTIEYVATDYDTPESIAARRRANPNDSWVDIYIKNNILETDYRAEQGGYNLRLGKRELKNLFLNTVIDNLVGDKLYGIDVYQEFIFEDDDLKVAPPRETFVQSVKILMELGKGDIPEYPELGLNKAVQIGSNLGLVSTPFIVRDLKETFASDDTMVNFTIDDVSIEASAIFLEFQVESFYNLTYKDSLQI